jgi:hypothetical protein
MATAPEWNSFSKPSAASDHFVSQEEETCMTDHPSTFQAADTEHEGVDWNEHATIHLKDGGQGVLGGLKALHSGTLAQMVAMISHMPEGERQQYVIQKAGDHRLGTGEIIALVGRADFPG